MFKINLFKQKKFKILFFIIFSPLIIQANDIEDTIRIQNIANTLKIQNEAFGMFSKKSYVHATELVNPTLIPNTSFPDGDLESGCCEKKICGKVFFAGLGLTSQSIGYGAAAILPIFAYLSNQSKELAITSAILNSIFVIQPLYLIPQAIGNYGSLCLWYACLGGSAPSAESIKSSVSCALTTNSLVAIFLYGTATAYAWYYLETGNENFRNVNIGTTLASGIFYAVLSNFSALCTICCDNKSENR
jgi:hypothetical protein